MPGTSGKRRCAAIARELEIPRPFNLDRFLAGLAGQRRRTIYLNPFASGPGVPCGLWIGTIEADHIFHEEGTTPWHKTHIILHEVAHMLLGHDAGAAVLQKLAGLLVPDVDPAMVRLILGRTAYSTQEERDAEALASLVLEHGSAVPRPAPAVGPGTAGMMYRLEQTWGGGGRAGFRTALAPVSN